MRMITCVARIKEGFTIAQAAREVWEVFGHGGRPDAAQIEEHIGWVNTPVQEGYFRCTFDPEYAAALQYVQEIDGAETVELISIEWEGQEMFQVGEYLDQDGVLQPEYLALIAGCPMKQTEAVEA